MNLDPAARELRELFRSRRQMYLAAVDPDAPYTAINPIWDGQADSRGIRRTEVWPKLTEYAADNRINVRQWVDTLFSMAYLFDSAPDPNRLLDKRVLDALRTSKERLHSDVVHRAKSQLLIAITKLHHAVDASALPPETVRKTVLAHPELDASPVVRYALARRLGLPDVARMFLGSATVEYAADGRAYDEAMGPYKPFLAELTAARS